MQGYIASVWGVVVGRRPDPRRAVRRAHLWRWIFFVNIPLCLLAGVLIWRNFHETVERRQHRIDYAGAVLLTSGMTLLILGVLEGGQAWAWSSPTSIAVFAVRRASCSSAFVLVERRAAEPVLPLWVLSRRLLLTTSAHRARRRRHPHRPHLLRADLPRGRRSGRHPLVGGLALAALTLGWPIAASLLGPAVLPAVRVPADGPDRDGSRPRSARCCSPCRAQTPQVAVVAVACFVIGLGLGLVAAPTLIAAQASVGWAERGVVTGANMFARSIGSAVGVAVFGAVANAVLDASGGPTDPDAVIDAGAAVFVAVLVATVLTIVSAVAMPKIRADDAELAQPAPGNA